MMLGFLLQGKAPDSKVPEKSRPRRPEKPRAAVSLSGSKKEGGPHEKITSFPTGLSHCGHSAVLHRHGGYRSQAQRQLHLYRYAR